MKILVTGAAGFIGHHLIQRLVNADCEILGLDSINDYYDINLKIGRLKASGIDMSSLEPSVPVMSTRMPNYRFVRHDLTDREGTATLFQTERFNVVCHLAAQAGVRYSLENPHAYIDSNINGFLNVLEGSRNSHVTHLVYASSSSVYGLNGTLPFHTSDNVDHPISLYAATKKADELMAHTYSYLYSLPTTGLRFFTVYGPWGRPDMALFKFTKSIIEKKPIDVYNHGDMSRDFTYIDDIIEGIMRVLYAPPSGDPSWSRNDPDPSSSVAPYRIYNIGNGSPVKLADFIEAIEDELGIKAVKNMLPMQPGDLPATHADISDLETIFQYTPSTPVRQGIHHFIRWYLDYYKIKMP